MSYSHLMNFITHHQNCCQGFVTYAYTHNFIILLLRISDLTSSDILHLLRGISYDDAKKVALVLGIPLNSIDNIRSTHTDPELYGHALILKWLNNCESSETEAIINQLAMAFRES